MPFKIGDRIRVKANSFEAFSYYNLQTGTVLEVHKGYYRVRLDSDGQVIESLHTLNAESAENGIERAKRIIMESFIDGLGRICSK